MNEKVRIVSSNIIIKEGLKTEFIIPKSNFWSVFKSCGSIKKKEKINGI